MNNIINHIAIVIDSSSSMYRLTKDVIRVVDSQVEQLAELSKKLDQETRVSIYMFDSTVRNLVFDKDVLRLPSIKTLYTTGGMTALIDASILGIEDLKKTPQMYGDHSFLMYVITDGEENSSKLKADWLLKTINKLDDNWTIAAFVPNANGLFFAKKFGFPADNIQVWSATDVGIEQVNNKMYQATHNYMQARSTGVRSTKNLFNIKTDKLNTFDIKQNLSEMARSKFRLYQINDKVDIKGFVEGIGHTYVIGNSFYQLTKPEKIQSAKQICIRSKKDKKVYTGQEARNLLGLPNKEVKVSPVNTNYDIFIQSTSVNRKLVPGTELLVMI